MRKVNKRLTRVLSATGSMLLTIFSIASIAPIASAGSPGVPVGAVTRPVTLEVQGARLETVVALLKAQTGNDNIVIERVPGYEFNLVSVKLADQPADLVLRAVARSAGAVVTLEDGIYHLRPAGSVRTPPIVPPTAPGRSPAGPRQMTKIYLQNVLPSNLVSRLGQGKIELPAGVGMPIAYDVDRSLLVRFSDPEGLTKFRQILQEMDIVSPPFLLKMRFAVLPQQEAGATSTAGRKALDESKATRAAQIAVRDLPAVDLRVDEGTLSVYRPYSLLRTSSGRVMVLGGFVTRQREGSAPPAVIYPGAASPLPPGTLRVVVTPRWHKEPGRVSLVADLEMTDESGAFRPLTPAVQGSGEASPRQPVLLALPLEGAKQPGKVLLLEVTATLDDSGAKANP